MPKSRKFTLLDIAKSDLLTAKVMRQHTKGDDKTIDICAYHCQQCVEKIAKHMVLLQGDDYAADHRRDVYLEDMADGEIKSLIESISYDIDTWATHIRYTGTILSGARAVDTIIALCEELVILADKETPEERKKPPLGIDI